MSKIAIQGDIASFHHIAAEEFFKSKISILPCETFAATFQATKEAEADMAVVAIENSLYGSINEVYDLLLKHHLWIKGEVYLRIKQCLIGLPDTEKSQITEVHSHPIALAQCEEFLDNDLIQAKRFEHHDTAASVADIKQWKDPAIAAIASQKAAQFHGLKILAEDIETNKENYTRFVVLGREKTTAPKANKTSLILMTDDRPGSLYRALGVFAEADINLTKLQSRPIIGKAWHYMFYVDVDGNTETEPLMSALKRLREQGCRVTQLGSYSAANPK